MKIQVPETLEQWNSAGEDYLPGVLGIHFVKLEADEVVATFEASRSISAWNGFLHAGAIVSLADTCCGYGALNILPDGADGFTTVELKTNFLSTVNDGIVTCSARPIHAGRSTQVWDAEVADQASGKVLAHFRCTQMILWPRTS